MIFFETRSTMVSLGDLDHQRSSLTAPTALRLKTLEINKLKLRRLK